jgi:hypothetical protein
MARNEFERECRPCPEFNQAPTGHKIPDGRSPDDPAMKFKVKDCGTRAFGEFSTPFFTCDEDLPDCLGRPDSSEHQGN